MNTFVFEAIGTHWQIEIRDTLSEAVQQALLQRIRERIAEYDQHYSRFRDDSLVRQMARQAGVYTLPIDAKPMFDLYHALYGVTDGLVTPLIGQVLIDAGYDAQYSLQPKTLHQPPKWEEVLEYAYPTLVVKRPVALDLGAMGKGYLIDIVAALLVAEGVASFCINAGGDILERGTTQDKALRVGLEHPADSTQVIGVATIKHQSMCGSAGNRRAWAQYHHILNPVTLSSPRDIIAVWTIASTTLLADGLSTALFFVPADKLATFSFEYLVLRSDYSFEKSPHFPGEMFIQ